MRNYFAYGSNMSRARLEERTGQVVHHGQALLTGYVHCFDHRGRDGTAKGNIALSTVDIVLGVLYELRDEQVNLLQPYEGGYEIIEVELELAAMSRPLRAYTYMSEISSGGIFPMDSYVDHYICGMQENGFPAAYIENIRKQAKQ